MTLTDYRARLPRIGKIWGGAGTNLHVLASKIKLLVDRLLNRWAYAGLIQDFCLLIGKLVVFFIYFFFIFFIKTIILVGLSTY